VEQNFAFDREVSWSVCDGTGYYDSQAECAVCNSKCAVGQRRAPACTGVETVDRACITCDLCQVGQYRSKVYEQCDGVTLEDTQNVCKDEPLGWHDMDGMTWMAIEFRPPRWA